MEQASMMLTAGAAYRAECAAALAEGARELAAARERLRRLTAELDEQERARAGERWGGESDDGLCRAVCTGTGAVVEVELDGSQYRRVTREQIEQAVLTAVGRAGAALAGEPDDALERPADDHPGARAEAIAEQYRQVRRQLATETVSGSAGGGTATAEFDGLGGLRRLRLSARALTDHDFPDLGRLITEALRAGASASVERREEAVDAVVIDGDTAGNWRRYPPDPAAAVRSAFGADFPLADGVVQS